MYAAALPIDLPRDEKGLPLRDMPAGLVAALDAFKQAQRLADMRKRAERGEHQWMLENGYETVAQKLENAVERTQMARDGVVQPTYDFYRPDIRRSSSVGINGDLLPLFSEIPKASARQKKRANTLQPLPSEALREWWGTILFWSFQMREEDMLPDLGDVEAWLEMMREPNCSWSAVWAAYCFAQVELAETVITL